MYRSDPNVILAIEKCIMRGRPVLLENCEEYIDSMVTPIIHHRNTALVNEQDEGQLLVCCNKRRYMNMKNIKEM